MEKQGMYLLSIYEAEFRTLLLDTYLLQFSFKWKLSNLLET